MEPSVRDRVALRIPIAIQIAADTGPGRRTNKPALRAQGSHQDSPVCQGSSDMPLTTILIILLVLLLVGALPAWPYSAGWGYYPSGGLGLLLLVLLIIYVVR